MRINPCCQFHQSICLTHSFSRIKGTTYSSQHQIQSFTIPGFIFLENDFTILRPFFWRSFLRDPWCFLWQIKLIYHNHRPTCVPMRRMGMDISSVTDLYSLSQFLHSFNGNYIGFQFTHQSHQKIQHLSDLQRGGYRQPHNC